MGTKLSTIEYCETHSTIAIPKGESQFEIKGIENGYVYFMVGKHGYHCVKIYHDDKRGQYFYKNTTKYYLNDFIFLNEKNK